MSFCQVKPQLSQENLRNSQKFLVKHDIFTGQSSILLVFLHRSRQLATGLVWRQEGGRWEELAGFSKIKWEELRYRFDSIRLDRQIDIYNWMEHDGTNNTI